MLKGSSLRWPIWLHVKSISLVSRLFLKIYYILMSFGRFFLNILAETNKNFPWPDQLPLINYFELPYLLALGTGNGNLSQNGIFLPSL